MKSNVLITAVALLIAATASAVTPTDIDRVRTDAAVIDRIAEISRRDIPENLLDRIVEEDLDLLRGVREDGSYEHATYERFEARRSSTSHSVQPRKNDANEQIEIRGAWVYRIIFDSPSRRMLVTKNRRIYLDRVELEYIPQRSKETRRQTIPIGAWLEPGQTRPVDFPDVARQATARVFARAEAAEGYGNLEITLVEARIVDNADSPYADAVATLKAIQRAIDARDVPSLRAMAARLRDSLGGSAAVAVAAQPASRTIDVVAAPASDPAIHAELQAIERLLTGTETQRREGLARLHDLVRKTRPMP